MTTRLLRLAKDLTLPLDAVTQTIAILAKRRAGKSYTMRRLIEQLLKAGQQAVIVDPKGDQWGLRSAADGNGPGLPIVILGGERGDVPLEASAGEIVAKLVVEERVSVLLDLSLFRKHEVATFMTAFLEHLYRLKAKEIYRTPVMLVIDEADAVAPQKPQKGEERMLGAAEDIVRRGGQRGIGCVLVTQRSAVLNKNVLTQAQVLIVLRTIAPQDLAAMKAWIDVHGDAEQGRVLMESLPSLPVGDAWFWSPGWPTTDGIFKRVHVLPIETFDSGASPKPGVKPIEPKNLADVDLDALKGQMAATIEKAKADDPRELRKALAAKDQRIKELETAASRIAPSNEGKKQEVKRVPVLTDADRALLEKLAATLDRHGSSYLRDCDLIVKTAETAFEKAVKRVVETGDDTLLRHMRQFEQVVESKGLQKILGKLATVPAPTPDAPTTPAERTTPARPSARPAGAVTPGGKLGQRIVNALAAAGRGLRRDQLGVRCVARSDAGHFGSTLADLKTAGLIVSNGSEYELTDAGHAVAGAPVANLVEEWTRKLSGLEAEIFGHLVKAYPEGLTRDRLGELTGKRSDAGHFGNCLSTLRGNGIAENTGRGSELVASKELFS